MKSLTCPLALAFTCTGALQAQQPSSMGTEFWLTYMENIDLGLNGIPYLYIIVSSDVNTQGELQVPSTGDAFPFTVTAGVGSVVFVPSNYSYPVGPEAYYPDGLRIVADDPVNVFAIHHRLYFSDATLVQPVERLGTEYLVVAHLDFNLWSPSQLVIEATQDGTVVQITPSVQTISFHPANVPYTITLDEGEVYQLQAYDDLSGTLIRSLDAAKPLAVFAGSKQGTVGCNPATDHQWTQLFSTQHWATEHVVVPYKDRGGDLFKLMALHDNTAITISGGPTIVLDSAEHVMQFIASPAVLSAQNPFAVVQFNQSQSCNTDVGDGTMAWVPPSDHLRDAVAWYNVTGPGGPPGGWTDEHALNIWTRVTEGLGTFLLDGVDITPSFLPMASAPTYWYAQLDIAEGAHQLTGTAPFQAQTSGFGDYNAFSYFLGFLDDDLGTGLLPGHGPGRSTGCTVVNDRWVLPISQAGAAKAVELFDPMGRRVIAMRLSGSDHTIDVTGLAEGQYHYAILLDDGGRRTGRIAIVR